MVSTEETNREGSGGAPGGTSRSGFGRVPPGRAELVEAMRRYQLAADIFDDAVAARLGLNRTDLRCVDILDQRAPMTAGALAQAARLSTGAVTFVLDRLEAAGFVRRGRDPGDRRRVLVEVVSAGMRKAEEMHVPMILDARKRLSGFSEDELATVRRFLCISAEIFERNVPE